MAANRPIAGAIPICGLTIVILILATVLSRIPATAPVQPNAKALGQNTSRSAPPCRMGPSMTAKSVGLALVVLLSSYGPLAAQYSYYGGALAGVSTLSADGRSSFAPGVTSTSL